MKGTYSMKTYVNPMLQIVGINKKDIITTSTFSMNYSTTMSDENSVGAPGRRGLFDPYDPYNAGY